MINMDTNRIRNIQKELNLGATRKYPQGKPFNSSDKGELKSAIVKDGNDIFIVFGKPVGSSYIRQHHAELGKVWSCNAWRCNVLYGNVM